MLVRLESTTDCPHDDVVEQQPPGSSHTLDNNDEMAGLKVLVIDDSTTIRRSAQIFLGQAKCEVILAEDGFGALAKVVETLLPP